MLCNTPCNVITNSGHLTLKSNRDHFLISSLISVKSCSRVGGFGFKGCSSSFSPSQRCFRLPQMFNVRQYLLNNFHKWPKGLSYSEPYCLDLQTTQISSLVQSTTLQVISDLLQQFVPDTLKALFLKIGL